MQARPPISQLDEALAAVAACTSGLMPGTPSQRDTTKQASDPESLLSVDAGDAEASPEPTLREMELPTQVAKSRGQPTQLPKWRHGIVGDHAWSPLFPTDRELKRIADRLFDENSVMKQEARALKFPTKAGADVRRARSELTRKPHFMTGGHSQAPLWRTAQGRLGGRAAATALRSGQLGASVQQAQSDSMDLADTQPSPAQRDIGPLPREGRSPKGSAAASIPADCSRCPQGHLLRECATPSTGWCCDVCLTSRLADSHLWRCGCCSHKVCDKCRHRGLRDAALGEPAGEPESLKGALRRPAKNHYEPRHEPAKVRGGQGRLGLRGVQSESDIRQFSRAVDPYSRRSFEVRQEFKRRHQQQLGASAASTWRALYQWHASERPLDSFCEDPPEGQRAKSYYKFSSR